MATTNQGKVRELRALLVNREIVVLSLADMPKQEEVAETGDSFAKNALLKAEAAYRKYHIPCVADDSGIVIDYFGGFPGVWSARFLPHMNYAEKNAFLLDVFADVPLRNAHYVCCLAYCDEKGYRLYEGSCDGEIATIAKGENGFGYDPIFYYPPLQATFAQLSLAVKNKISHRAIALRKLVSSFEKM